MNQVLSPSLTRSLDAAPNAPVIQNVNRDSFVSPKDVSLVPIPVNPLHVDPTLSAWKTDRETLCADALLDTSQCQTPSLVAEESVRLTVTVVLEMFVISTGVFQDLIRVTPLLVAPTQSAMKTDRVTLCALVYLDINLNLIPLQDVVRLRPELHHQIHASPVHVVQTLTAMSTGLVTQFASASQATSLLQTPSQDARKNLIHATQILVAQMLTVYQQEIQPPVGVQLVTREIHLYPAEREIANTIVSAQRAWLVSTTTARTHALAHVDKIQTVRLGITDPFAVVLRDLEVIL